MIRQLLLALLLLAALMRPVLAWGHSAEPRFLDAEEASRRALAAVAKGKISYTGLLFHEGKLKVGTKLGLFVFRGASLEGMYTWSGKSNSVDSPVVIDTKGRLWLFPQKRS